MMRYISVAIITISAMLAGCIQHPPLPEKEIPNRLPSGQSRYMPQPRDWNKLLNSHREVTQNINVFRKGKAGYLITVRDPWTDTQGESFTNTVYMVYDANLKAIGYFTENGHTEKFYRTEKGDLGYKYWGLHTHDAAIKSLLDIPDEEVLEISKIDTDWILGDLYPNPKPELPTGPKPKEGEGGEEPPK